MDGDGNAALSGNVGLVSASKLSTGKYQVTFNQQIGFCVRVASLGRRSDFTTGLAFSGTPGEIYTFLLFTGAAVNPEEMIVVTYDSVGVFSDRVESPPLHSLNLCRQVRQTSPTTPGYWALLSMVRHGLTA